MSVSARAGDVFSPTGVGVPMLGVGQDGRLAPLAGGADPVSTNELNVPAAHTAAVITLDAITNYAHIITGLAYSYSGSGTLAGGRITVADGSDTIFDLDISDKKEFVIPLKKQGHAGRAMTITLADGGANVQGKVNLLGHWTTLIVQGGVLDLNDEGNSGLLSLFF